MNEMDTIVDYDDDDVDGDDDTIYEYYYNYIITDYNDNARTINYNDDNNNIHQIKTPIILK